VAWHLVASRLVFSSIELHVELKSTALVCQIRYYLVVSVIMVGSSEYLCSAGGRFCIHSFEFLVCVENKVCRLSRIFSHGHLKSLFTFRGY
jgi:hypothetical protein